MNENETFEIMSIGFNAMQDAIENLDMPLWSEDSYVPIEEMGQRWRIYKRQENLHPYEWKLVVQIKGICGMMGAEISLRPLAFYLTPKIDEFLKSSEFVGLFGVIDDASQSELLYNQVRAFFVSHINQLPLAFFNTLELSPLKTLANILERSLTVYIKEHLENPQQRINLIRKFISDSIESEIVENLKKAVETEKFYTGEIKITQDQLENLPAQYNSLREGYKQAHIQHNVSRQAFFSNNPKASVNNWRDAWWNESQEKFPHLRLHLLQGFAEHSDGKKLRGAETYYQLSYRHLAMDYGHSSSYMKKLVEEQRGLKKPRKTRKTRKKREDKH